MQISILLDELDEKNDLELVKPNIDSCVALVSEYLDSRRDDPPSKSSLCSSWVAKHAVGMMENVSRDGQSTDVASTSPEEQLSTREPSITEEPLWVAEIGDQGIGGNVEDRPTNGVSKTGEIGGEGHDNIFHVSGSESKQYRDPGLHLLNTEQSKGALGQAVLSGNGENYGGDGLDDLLHVSGLVGERGNTHFQNPILTPGNVDMDHGHMGVSEAGLLQNPRLALSRMNQDQAVAEDTVCRNIEVFRGLGLTLFLMFQSIGRRLRWYMRGELPVFLLDRGYTTLECRLIRDSCRTIKLTSPKTQPGLKIACHPWVWFAKEPIQPLLSSIWISPILYRRHQTSLPGERLPEVTYLNK